MDDDMLELTMKEEQVPLKLRPPRKIHIPRRRPSVVLPPFVPHYPTPDKITCAECGCFPKEEPYKKHKKLSPCVKSPPPLYELSAAAVEALPSPPALRWTVPDVARWCEGDLALPQYTECFIANQIDGRRLLMLEDPSVCPHINIHDFEHIKRITRRVRSLFGTDEVRFSRSVGLPPRRPLVHCTWYQSRTGPGWGRRVNWTRADILRWMKVLPPAPARRDHWDLVWYLRPDFPTVKVGRVGKSAPRPAPTVRQPPQSDPVCSEYQVPRKFRLQSNIPEKDQMIWTQRSPEIDELRGKEKDIREGGGKRKEEAHRNKKKRTFPFAIPEHSNLLKKPVSLDGKRGDQLLLARRQMDKHKFLAF